MAELDAYESVVRLYVDFAVIAGAIAGATLTNQANRRLWKKVRQLGERALGAGFFFIPMSGSVAAIYLSWTTNHSVWWAFVHTFFSWFYVIYWYSVI